MAETPDPNAVIRQNKARSRELAKLRQLIADVNTERSSEAHIRVAQQVERITGGTVVDDELRRIRSHLNNLRNSISDIQESSKLKDVAKAITRLEEELVSRLRQTRALLTEIIKLLQAMMDMDTSELRLSQLQSQTERTERQKRRAERGRELATSGAFEQTAADTSIRELWDEVQRLQENVDVHGYEITDFGISLRAVLFQSERNIINTYMDGAIDFIRSYQRRAFLRNLRRFFIFRVVVGLLIGTLILDIVTKELSNGQVAIFPEIPQSGQLIGIIVVLLSSAFKQWLFDPWREEARIKQERKDIEDRIGDLSNCVFWIKVYLAFTSPYPRNPRDPDWPRVDEGDDVGGQQSAGLSPPAPTP